MFFPYYYYGYALHYLCAYCLKKLLIINAIYFNYSRISKITSFPIIFYFLYFFTLAQLDRRTLGKVVQVCKSPNIPSQSSQYEHWVCSKSFKNLHHPLKTPLYVVGKVHMVLICLHLKVWSLHRLLWFIGTHLPPFSLFQFLRHKGFGHWPHFQHCIQYKIYRLPRQ